MQKRKPFFPPCLSLAGTLWVHYADGHEKFEKSDPRLKLSVRDEGSGGKKKKKDFLEFSSVTALQVWTYWEYRTPV